MFKPYTKKDQREEVEQKQATLSYDEIKHLMQKKNEFALELDNLPIQQHNWTDRGLKLTCENAGHPYHEAFKIRKPMTKA